jgi:hypothetical protein
MSDDDIKPVGSILKVGFFTEDAPNAELCRQYWQLDSTGAFMYTVATIGQAFNLPASSVSALVEQSCRAYAPDVTCRRCGEPHRIRNRADYVTWKRLRDVPRECAACREAQQRDAQNTAEELNRLRVAVLQDELDARRRDYLWVPPTRLSFDDAVFLLALIRAGGSEDLSFITPHAALALPLSPTSAFDRRILDQLYLRRILAIHPGSSPDSVVSGDAGPFTTFYPFKVHWTLPLPIGPSPARYLEDLEAVLMSTDWPESWDEEARELHRAVAFEECIEYLRLSLEEHGFDSQPGEKLSLVIRSALRHFSIGQVYNFIWRAARDAAAFYVREQTSKSHARNIVPGSIQRAVERALAEGWTVKPYRRDRRAPESQVSHVLFTMALRLPEGGFHAVPPRPVEREPSGDASESESDEKDSNE